MADIIADSIAVYGFGPSPEGGLKQYADIDWSDSAVVEARSQDRMAYRKSIASLYDMLESMVRTGASTEEIARAVSTRRNEIRLESYAGNPEGLAAVKARNLERYGNENGGTPDYFYAQYGSWETVVDKSFSTNSSMDACVGLYDDYYDFYVLIGQIEDDGRGAAEADDPTSPCGAGQDGTSEDPKVSAAGQQAFTASDNPSVRPAAANGSPAASPRHTVAMLPATGDPTGGLPTLASGIVLSFLGTCLRRREESRAA